MTTLALPVSSVWSEISLRRLARDEPLFAAGAVLLVLLIVPTLAAHVLETRTFNGVNVWDKVLKFEFALALWLATLAFYARWLPAGLISDRRYRAFSIIVLIAIAGELIWIGGAAANGVGSHFNVGTPLMAAIYGLMGAFAVTLTSAALVHGLAIRRNRNAGLSEGMHVLVWTSLVATFVATVIAAGTLSTMESHFIGGTPSDATGGFLFGWSRDGGDLRVSHFLATHVLHVVPAAGWLIERSGRPLSTTTAVLLLALYLGLVAFTYGQALMGQPFLPGIL